MICWKFFNLPVFQNCIWTWCSQCWQFYKDDIFVCARTRTVNYHLSRSVVAKGWQVVLWDSLPQNQSKLRVWALTLTAKVQHIVLCAIFKTSLLWLNAHILSAWYQMLLTLPCFGIFCLVVVCVWNWQLSKQNFGLEITAFITGNTLSAAPCDSVVMEIKHCVQLLQQSSWYLEANFLLPAFWQISRTEMLQCISVCRTRTASRIYNI